MDISKIAELANIMKQNGLTKLELTEGESHLVLESGKSEGVVVPMVQETVQITPMPKEQPKPILEDDFYEQKTPLVGTVYLASQSGAAPYVSVGDHINAGDTICIVESMKMFNQIAAECSGIVEEICVSDAQIVEYGQTLFRIRED